MYKRMLDQIPDLANFSAEASRSLDAGGIACVVQYNRNGSNVAVGTNDGKVTVFCATTGHVVRSIQSHAQMITSLSFSWNNRLLASSSLDGNVAIINIDKSEINNRYRFPNAVVHVDFHPVNFKKILIFTVKYPPTILNISDTETVDKMQLPTDELDAGESFADSCFDRTGKYIVTVSSKTKVCIFRTEDLQCVASFRLMSGTQLKMVHFGLKSDTFLTIATDRVIRLYDFQRVLKNGKCDGDFEPIRRFQDMVNRTMWRCCCMSANGGYICGASAKNIQIYIWEKTGNLVKILSGGKGETLVDLAWHPCRPEVVAVSSGNVYIWAQAHVENWSAFAPDFQELDENIIYQEKEGEFDAADEDASDDETKKEIRALEEADLDIENDSVHSSDIELGIDVNGLSEDERPLRFLTAPTDVDVDISDINMTTGSNDFLNDSGDSASKRNNRVKVIDVALVRPPSQTDGRQTTSFTTTQNRKRPPQKTDNSKARRNRTTVNLDY